MRIYRLPEDGTCACGGYIAEDTDTEHYICTECGRLFQEPDLYDNLGDAKPLYDPHYGEELK